MEFMHLRKSRCVLYEKALKTDTAFLAICQRHRSAPVSTGDYRYRHRHQPAQTGTYRHRPALTGLDRHKTVTGRPGLALIPEKLKNFDLE
jgi:hypothetical protein